MNDGVNNHFLDRDRVVSADGAGHFGLQPELKVNEREQINQGIELIPQIAGYRALDRKLAVAVGSLELGIISEAAPEPMCRTDRSEFNTSLRELR
jgi:hypothetical protein